ncbi:MAG: Na+/H+ antiporter subunit E [Proteobacteria bacterium]|jgi:multicomponent K+:H+ antiporter subunit E|nr:Na+/H+ antiporter subunit E [Pseudomonadota bacterium]
MRRRWLPAPLLSLALAVLWLVLMHSVGPGQILLALLVGWLLPVLFAPLRPDRVRMRRPLTLLRLIGVVVYDGLLSNWQLLVSVLRRARHPPRSRFVQIPLELRDETALACLCIIATAVPGTVWCETSHDHSVVVIHVWDVPDEARFIADFKTRYERPLMEIFE